LLEPPDSAIESPARNEWFYLNALPVTPRTFIVTLGLDPLLSGLALDRATFIFYPSP
jgi:hypothetical protein